MTLVFLFILHTTTDELRLFFIVCINILVVQCRRF